MESEAREISHVPSGNIDARWLFSQSVIQGLNAANRAELIGALVARQVEARKIGATGATATIQDALMPPELWRTPDGKGIVCYHGATELVDSLVGCAAVLKTPIAAARAAEPGIHAAFLFLGPRKLSPMLVKLCAEVGRLASDPEFSKALFETSDESAISAELMRRFARLDIHLHARDVMREPLMYLTPDTPLAVVVKHMLEFNVEAIGIVDGEKRIVGEVTSDRLFKMGMPDFFSQLRSVAFVGDFDPFEKYFEKEAGVRTADVMASDFAAVTEEAPILEVLFYLAVRRHVKVYVVRDGIMIGVIDRMRVLQKVLGL